MSDASAQVPLPALPNTPWQRGGATLDLDFVHDQYWLNGTNYADNGSPVGTALANFISGAGATFTRAGTTNVTTASPPSVSPFFLPSADSFVSRADSTPIATYFNSSGVLTTVSSAGAGRTAAYTYNGSSWVPGGTLAEPAATNSIRNNTMVGAVAGTPGTVPTDWQGIGTPSGITSQIVGTGTENGIAYIDINWSGTATATGGCSVYLESKGGISASIGQTWTASVFVKLSAGSWSGVNGGATTPIAFENAMFPSSGSVLGYTSPYLFAATTAALSTQRATYSSTITQAATAQTVPIIVFYVNSGNTINVTLRIGMPQMEQSSYATSPIATSGTAVTRAADVYSVPSGGTYFNGSGVLTQAAVNTPRLDHSPTGNFWPMGVLIEEGRTNSIRNNTMVGAVPADGVERTNNGTFSTTSPNVCSGGVTSSTNTLSCNNGTGTGWVGTVNSGAGTVTAASGSMTLTGDGTHAASIYQAITTTAGFYYILAVTANSGNALTVQVGASIGATDVYPATGTTGITTTYFEFPGGVTRYIQINNTSATPVTITAVSVQSAGAFPTNWAVGTNNGSWDNIAATVIGTGTTATGINYVDLKFAGTSSTASQNFSIKTAGTNVIAASNGQSWTHSVYVALVGGSTANLLSTIIGADEYSATPAYLGSAGNLSYTPTSTLTRYSAALTTNSSSIAYIQPTMYNTFGNGAVINITLRIGMPQMELGAFPTSVIATYGSAVTRAADAFTVPKTASGSNGAWYTAGQGTLMASGTVPYANSLANQRLAALDDGTINNEVDLVLQATGQGQLAQVKNGGTNSLAANFANVTANALNKGVVAYESGDASGTFNGATVAAASGVTVPTMSELDIGEQAGGLQLDGWVNHVWYMPTRQPDRTLADYTW